MIPRPTAAGTNSSRRLMSAGWATRWNSKRYACTHRMLSLCDFGSTDSKIITHLYSIRTSLISLPWILSWSKTPLCCVSKPSFSWTRSGASGIDSLESTRRIMLPHIRGFYYLQSSRGLTGAMVSNYCYGDLAQGRLYSDLGVPVAWMLASNGTTVTIAFFLQWIRDASPSVQPAVIMTDRDQAQINALEAIYPQSTVNLCTWHVLRAMRSHFNTNQYPVLWNKVKTWVKTNDQIEFTRLWVEISGDPSAPQSFIAYLKAQWLPVTLKWSRVLRKGRSIYEEGDTNMLIEAYVFALFGR